MAKVDPNSGQIVEYRAGVKIAFGVEHWETTEVNWIKLMPPIYFKITIEPIIWLTVGRYL